MHARCRAGPPRGHQDLPRRSRHRLHRRRRRNAHRQGAQPSLQGPPGDKRQRCRAGVPHAQGAGVLREDHSASHQPARVHGRARPPLHHGSVPGVDAGDGHYPRGGRVEPAPHQAILQLARLSAECRSGGGGQMTTAAAPMHVARPTPPRRAAPTDEELKARARLLEKLVAIASRDPDCLSQIVTLTRDEEDFPRLMEEAERHVRELPSTTEERRVAPAAVDVRVRPLCERITRSDSLCTLFKSEPSFVTRAAREIATLAAMATLRPHPDLMVEAQDGPFMRILRHLAQPGATTAERLVFEDFLKLIALRHASADIVDLLWPVADADDWAGQ